MKFHLNNLNGCQLTERTRNSIANDQRGITPKISKAELWFLCMTRRLHVLCDYFCYKGDNLKNTNARIMVLVHDTSSQWALQMYEVLLKYL